MKKFLLASLVLFLLIVIIVSAFWYKPFVCPGGRFGDAIRLKPSTYLWPHPIWPILGKLPQEILGQGSIALWVFADDVFLNTTTFPLVGLSGQFRIPRNPKVPAEDDIMQLLKDGEQVRFVFRSIQDDGNLMTEIWDYPGKWIKNKWNYVIIAWKSKSRPKLFLNGKEIGLLATTSPIIAMPVDASGDLRLDIGGYRKAKLYLPSDGILLDETALYIRGITSAEATIWYRSPIKARQTADWMASWDKSGMLKFNIENRLPSISEFPNNNIFNEFYNFENAPTQKCNIFDFLSFRRYFPNLKIPYTPQVINHSPVYKDTVPTFVSPGENLLYRKEEIGIEFQYPKHLKISEKDFYPKIIWPAISDPNYDKIEPAMRFEVTDITEPFANIDGLKLGELLFGHLTKNCTADGPGGSDYCVYPLREQLIIKTNQNSIQYATFFTRLVNEASNGAITILKEKVGPYVFAPLSLDGYFILFYPDDPFFMYPESIEKDFEIIANTFNFIPQRFVGIGVKIVPTATKGIKGVSIERVFEHGPAAEAGLQRGDIILEIDGYSTFDMRFEDASKLLKAGENDSVVALTIRQQTTQKIITIPIKRKEFIVKPEFINLEKIF